MRHVTKPAGNRANGSLSGVGRAICVSLMFVVLPRSLQAKAFDEQDRPSPYTFRQWSIEDGLPTNSITSVAETKDGYIWMTTHEGLVQFDGVRFRTFNAMNTPEFTSSYMTNAQIDGRGRLWFCIQGVGVVVRENGQFNVYGAHKELSSSEITDIVVTPDESVWIATDGDGLFLLKDGQITRRTIYDGLPSNRLTALHYDIHGRLWVATTANGVAILEENTIRQLDGTNGLPSNRVSLIFPDVSESIWVVTDKGLVHFLDGDVDKPDGQQTFLANDITSSTLDPRGGLWLGTVSHGVFRQINGRSVSLPTADAMRHSPINDIFSDSNGNLWVATDGSGVFFFYRGLFQAYNRKDGLSSDAILSMHEDGKGTLWLGTRGGGLDKVTGQNITTYTVKNGLAQNQILSLLVDKRGRVFAGTVDNGISIMKNGKSFEPYSSVLAGTRVSSIIEDHNGVIWAGLSRGLLRIDGNNSKIFSEEEGLPHENVKCLAEDHDGNLWVGTKGGLVVYRDGKFLREFKGHSLPEQTTVWIHVDASNELWIGTYDAGLLHLGPRGFGRVTTRNGLYKDSVFAILEDQSNHLWMSSSYGIFRVPKSQLRRVALGHASQVKSQIFGVEEGLESRECIGGGNNTALKTSDGRLWFATIGGLAVIDPSQARREVNPPDVHIEQIWVDGQEIQDTNELALEKNANRIRIRFSAPYFIAPERLRFKYRLEGFESQWVESGDDRTAHYTNLPPGDYVFRVFATSEERLWTSKTASIPVKKPPTVTKGEWYPLLVGGIIWLLGTIIISLLLLRAHRRLSAYRRHTAK